MKMKRCESDEMGLANLARNRERRVALARASGLLQQLTSSLMPLTAESAEPELVAENAAAAV
jgi:hypothetical protein